MYDSTFCYTIVLDCEYCIITACETLQETKFISDKHASYNIYVQFTVILNSSSGPMIRLYDTINKIPLLYHFHFGYFLIHTNSVVAGPSPE